MQKIFCMVGFWRNLRFRYQVIIFEVASLMVVTLIMMLLVDYFIGTAQGILIDSSRSLSSIQTQQSLSNIMLQFDKLGKRTLIQSRRELLIVNLLFGLVQSNIIQQITAPHNSLSNASNRDHYAFYHSFSYGTICDYQYPQIAILNHTSLLTELLPILDLQRYTYYTDLTECQYFTVYRGNNFTGFKPQTRPWFLYHIQHMATTVEDTIYSDPYYGTDDLNYVGHTSNLTYLNGSLAGVISQDVTFVDFTESNQNLQFLIANSTGSLMFTPNYQYNVNTTFNFYDTSITGFNFTDWVTISNMNSSKPVLLYNSKMDQQVYVTCSKWTYPQYYSIVYTSAEDYLEYQTHIENSLSNLIQEKLTQGVIIFCALLVSIIMIVLVSLCIVLKPLTQIYNLTQYKLYGVKQMMFQRNNIRSEYYGQTIIEFIQAYLRLQSRLSSRTEPHMIQIALQEIEYPLYEQRNQIRRRISYFNPYDMTDNLASDLDTSFRFL